MKRKHPQYTHGYVDQHGRPRFYLRRAGFKKVALPGLPWSPEFMAARELALNDSSSKIELGAKRTVAGTVNAGLVSYYQSASFTGLAESSQKMRRAELERFRADHGDKRLQLMHKRALQNILNGKTPAAQRNWKKAMRGFLAHCLALDMIKVDPLAGVTLSKIKTIGHHPWESWECEQFEAHHAVGTRARLAYELLLQAGQSKCDVVRMGRQHIRKGMMTMRRQKTGVPFNVEITQRLQAAIDAMPESNYLTFLVTGQGSHSRQQASGTTFVICVSQPSCRRGAPLTVCERRRLPTSPRWAQRTINSWPGLGGHLSRKPRSTPRKRTESAWPWRPGSSFREQELAHRSTL